MNFPFFMDFPPFKKTRGAKLPTMTFSQVHDTHGQYLISPPPQESNKRSKGQNIFLALLGAIGLAGLGFGAGMGLTMLMPSLSTAIFAGVVFTSTVAAAAATGGIVAGVVLLAVGLGLLLHRRMQEFKGTQISSIETPLTSGSEFSNDDWKEPLNDVDTGASFAPASSASSASSQPTPSVLNQQVEPPTTPRPSGQGS